MLSPNPNYRTEIELAVREQCAEHAGFFLNDEMDWQCYCGATLLSDCKITQRDEARLCWQEHIRNLSPNPNYLAEIKAGVREGCAEHQLINYSAPHTYSECSCGFVFSEGKTWKEHIRSLDPNHSDVLEGMKQKLLEQWAKLLCPHCYHSTDNLEDAGEEGWFHEIESTEEDILGDPEKVFVTEPCVVGPIRALLKEGE